MSATSKKMAANVQNDEWGQSGKRLKPKEIRRKIKVWKKRLGLQGTEIVFDPSWEAGTHEDGSRGSAWATIWRSDDYHYNALALREGWETAEEALIDNSIVHELFHILERDKDGLVHNALAGHLSPAVYQLFIHEYDHHREGVAEMVSNILVDAYGPA